MDEATEIFSSLSQETRLRVLMLLIEYGGEGAPAGKLAEELEIPANTLSFHLSHLSKARIVTSRKAGRVVTYFSNPALFDELVGFIQENCCAREGKNRGGKKSCRNPRKC